MRNLLIIFSRHTALEITDITLSMDLEENLFFDMDTAVPLGMIVNELVSNSLKHAFIGRDKGEIQIKLLREEDGEYKKEGDKEYQFYSDCFRQWYRHS